MRLTKEDIEKALSTTTFFGERVVGKTMFYTMAKELIKYKDIEEEFGIDLIILIKALRDGIKAKWENNEIVHLIVFGACLLWLNKKCFQLIDYNKKEWFYYFKDYGKTWALTREELL